MTTDPTVQLSESAAATRLDDDTMVVLHLREQTYFELNRTGSQIWEHLSENGPATVDALVGVVSEQSGPDVPPRENVRADVESFIASMQDAGLVTTPPPADEDG